MTPDNAVTEKAVIDEEAAFIEAFESVALQRISDEVGKPFVLAGLIGVNVSRIAEAEHARVEALIARDKADRIREIDRKAAEIDMANGKTVSIGEAVIEPTPEWFSHGEHATFTPRLEDGTVRTVKGFRRRLTPTAAKLCLDGKITDTQYLACRWYRAIHDQAGVEGRYKTANLSLAGNVGGGGGGQSQHPMAAHEHEAMARQTYRLAKMRLNARFLPVFEFVVIHDLSLRAAATRAERDNARLLANFRHAAQQMADLCDALQVALDAPSEQDD
jgi:hypothetical protein